MNLRNKNSLNIPPLKKGGKGGFYSEIIVLLLFSFLLLLIPLSLFAQGSETIPSRILKGIEADATGVRIVPEKGQVIFLAGKDLISFDAGSGKELARYKFGVSEFPLRLDLIDIDADGSFELPVTVTIVSKPSSYIFKYKDGEGFSVIARELPYFFRVIEKNGAKVLIGQSSERVIPFAGKVYERSWDGAKLVKKTAIDLPRNVNLYQFADSSSFALSQVEGRDVHASTGSARTEIIPVRPEPVEGDAKLWARDDEGRLKLFEKQGRKWKVIYRSPEKYRGGVKCVEFWKRYVMSEDVKDQLCVPTPPVVIELPVHLSTSSGRTGVANFHPSTSSGRTLAASVRPEPVEGQELIIVDGHDFLMAGVMLTPNDPHKAYMNILSYSDADGLMDCKRLGPYEGWIGDYFVEQKLFVLRNMIGSIKGGARVDDVNISNIDCSSKI